MTERLPPFFSFHRYSPYLWPWFLHSPAVYSFTAGVGSSPVDPIIFLLFHRRTGSTLLHLSAILLSSSSPRLLVPAIRSGPAVPTISFCSPPVVSARTSLLLGERSSRPKALAKGRKKKEVSLSSFFSVKLQLRSPVSRLPLYRNIARC